MIAFLKPLGRGLGGSWESLGRVLGGFWEGLGALWTLQGLFSVVSGLCWALLVLPGIFLLFLAFPGLSQPFLAFAGLCWLLLGFNACYYCWGRAKLSDAFSGFPLLTHAFVGAPLLSLAFCCFASLHVVWHFLLNGTSAFLHSCSILFLVAPCLVLFSLVLPCANIS